MVKELENRGQDFAENKFKISDSEDECHQINSKRDQDSQMNPLVTYDVESEGNEVERSTDSLNRVPEPEPKQEKVESEPETDCKKEEQEIVVDPHLKPIETDLTFENLVSYGCTSKCSQELTDKVVRMAQFAKSQNIDLNKYISNKKELKNPQIYEKLIKHLGIDERGTYFYEEATKIKSYREEGNYIKLDKDLMNYWQSKHKEEKS